MKINKLLIIFSVIFLFNVILISGAVPNFGIFKINNDILLKQTATINGSFVDYCNISSVTYPNGSNAVTGIAMTQDGSEFYYNLASTSVTEIGEYKVNGYCGIEPDVLKNFVYYFEVSTNGKTSPDGIIVVFFSLIFIGIFFFGLLYFLKSLSHVIEFNMDLIDTATMIGIYLSMWLFYYFAREYMGNLIINNLLEMAISVGAVTHVFLPLVGFAVSFIMTHLQAKKKSQVTY